MSNVKFWLRNFIDAQSQSCYSISDGIDGEVYIFADGTDGTGNETIDFNGTSNKLGFGSDDVLADVAQFLNAGLGAGNGEHYVAIINVDATAGGLHAIYLVEGDADGIQADNLTLLGQVSTNGANNFTAGDIA